MGSGFLNRAIHDILFIMLAFFIFAVVLMMPHLNPDAEANENDIKMQGMLVFEIQWGDSINADIDMWVRAPKEGAVGYAFPGNSKCNLLRDDLGHIDDPGTGNFEIVVCRGLVPNEEYDFNINYYKNRTGGARPVMVSAKVTRTNKHLTPHIVDERKIILMVEDAESTVIRFTLNDEGFVTMKHRTFETLLPDSEK